MIQVIPNSFEDFIKLMREYVDSDILEIACNYNLAQGERSQEYTIHDVMWRYCDRAITGMETRHDLSNLSILWKYTSEGHADSEGGTPCYSLWLELIGVVKTKKDTEGYTSITKLNADILDALNNKHLGLDDDDYDILRI